MRDPPNARTQYWRSTTPVFTLVCTPTALRVSSGAWWQWVLLSLQSFSRKPGLPKGCNLAFFLAASMYGAPPSQAKPDNEDRTELKLNHTPQWLRLASRTSSTAIARDGWGQEPASQTLGISPANAAATTRGRGQEPTPHPLASAQPMQQPQPGAGDRSLPHTPSASAQCSHSQGAALQP